MITKEEFRMIANENGREVEIVEVADVLNPELPAIDGTKVRISFGETIPTVQFGNIRPEISIEIPTQRKLIRKAIQSGYALLKEEYDKIVKEIMQSKGL